MTGDWDVLAAAGAGADVVGTGQPIVAVLNTGRSTEVIFAADWIDRAGIVCVAGLARVVTWVERLASLCYKGVAGDLLARAAGAQRRKRAEQVQIQWSKAQAGWPRLASRTSHDQPFSDGAVVPGIYELPTDAIPVVVY